MAVGRIDGMRRGAAMLGAVAMLTLTADRAPIETVAMRNEAAMTLTTAPQTLFISGHSLTSRPFPDHLAAIAAAADTPLTWRMQHRAGSSLRDRATDTDDGAYDVQLLAERHTLLEGLMLDDTVPQLAARAGGKRTYLFASWLNVGDLHDPGRWIAYEAVAGPAWRCVARAAEGRDAIDVVPASEAMAWLVQSAIAREVAGISAATPRETMRAIFTDDVHPTDAASFYVALVTHGVLHGSLPDGPVSSGIAPETAAALRTVAASFIAQPRRIPGDAAACRRYLADIFAPAYLAYVRDTRWRELGWARARARWLHHRMIWPGRIKQRWGADPLAV